MKKLLHVLPLAMILCFMVGCQDKEAVAELEAFKAQAEIEEQNKALVLKWCEEQDKGNLDIFLEMFAPNFLPIALQGRPEVIKEVNREQPLTLKEFEINAKVDNGGIQL